MECRLESANALLVSAIFRSPSNELVALFFTVGRDMLLDTGGS